MATKKTTTTTKATEKRYVQVKFTSSRETTGTYTYEDNLDTPLELYDVVLAPTQFGYAIAVVESLSPNPHVINNCSKYSYGFSGVIKSIEEKLESKTLDRHYRKKRADALKKTIEKKIKEVNQLELFKKAAENNPELQAMVNQLEELQKED